jgi:hypothetical protein
MRLKMVAPIGYHVTSQKCSTRLHIISADYLTSLNTLGGFRWMKARGLLHRVVASVGVQEKMFLGPAILLSESVT